MAGTTDIQPPVDKTKTLYEAVSKDYNVGTYDEFKGKLQDPVKRKAFYNGVGKEYDLGSYDEFQDKIGVSKKKDTPVPGAGPTPSPSASSPKPAQTAPSVDTSASGSKAVTANYKNNSLTPKDVDDKPLGFQVGPTPDQISHAINNKGKNLDQWSNSASDGYIKSLVSQHQRAQQELAKLDATPGSGAVGDAEGMAKRKQDRDKLASAEQYFRGQIQKEYDAKKQKLVPELAGMLKAQVDDSEFDPETHKLKPISVQWVARHVDGIMNQKNDAVVNAAVSGDLDKKERTYQDLTKDVVDQLNLIPIQKKQEEFTKDYFDKNPAMKDAYKAVSEVNDYFSKSNFDDVKAKVNVNRDKALIQTKDKYYGTDGIFQKNQDYVSIQHKYAELVGDGKMTEEVAIKQMQAEIKQNPNLQKIDQSFQNELKKVQEKTQQEYQNYIVSGLKGKYPNLAVYEDGSIGVASLSKDQYTNMMEGYQEGMTDIAKKMGAESNAAFQKQANEKARKQGAFLGSAASATNELMSGLTKMVFNKTGWGGDRVRNFESQEIAAPQVSQSDVAATWNWKGVESLINPNFYLSGVGGMVPVIVGGAAVGIATEGTGVPEYVGWLANAGLFTAQSSISTYNNLLGSRDKDGNQLTESDAAHFAAEQAEKDFLPNVLMMAVTSGALTKAKSIMKPTILGTVGKALAGTAAAQPFFTWQGYNDYATMLEAQGKTPDFNDYLQSKDFRDNLVNGMVMGGAFSLMHAPGQYMKSMDNWTKLVHTSEGEFKNLLSQNFALGTEMAGDGNYLRDALKMHIFNIDPEGLNEEGKRQLADLKNTLLYSVNLDKNLKTGNLDKNNVNDVYQAHNLALADQHDYLADQAAKQGNQNLSDVYKDKAKDYREQAKAAANDQAKYHYLVNDDGHPIFISENSFKTLEADGKIAKWMKDGTIKDVVKSDDPEFAARYKDFVQAKDEATVEGQDVKDHAATLIEQNKEKLGPFYFQAKANPEGFLNTVSEEVKSDEAKAREQYGNDIVDLAKVLHPETEELKPEVEKPTAGRGEEKVEDKEPTGEYKPQIRDDYFAKADFFTPEEKEKFATLDDAGKDKMIDDKRAELKSKAEVVIPKVGDAVQWVSQGAEQFDQPKKVTSISDDGKFAFVEGSNTGIPIDQLSISSPIKSESDEKTKEAEGRQGDEIIPESEGGEGEKAPAGTPPSVPPPVVGPTEGGLHPHNEEWISIQKKDLSERVQKENAFTQTNRETVDKVVGRLSQEAAKNGRTWQSQAEFETNALHNEFFNEDGTIKQAFNPTTDELALIGIRLMDINGEASVNEFNPNDDQQTARTAYLENEKMKAERLLSFGEAGRAFQFRQSLLKMGINGDIQIKRKAISASVGIKIPENEEQFKELSPLEQKKIKPIYDAFNKWKAEYEKENKARNTLDEKYSKEEFDKRIKAAVADALKEAKVPEKGAKITKESSKKVADKLKSFADKFEKFGRADLPEGTEKMGLAPDIQKKIADAIRWIAEKIANGDLKIPELISEAIQRFKDKDLTETDLAENIKSGLKEAGIDDKILNDKTNREDILDKMKEIAKNSGVDTITQKMVDSGMIRDYLHDIAKRGETDPQNILAKGIEELRDAFPALDEKTLRDAYLKEGAFTPDTSKDLEDKVKKAAQTFRDVTILQRDIEALEAGDKLYGADKETRNTIISDYEQKLKDEKEKIIKDRDDAIKKNKVDYRKLESERNRQLKKVGELKDKLRQLQSGTRPESTKDAPKEDTPEIESLKEQVRDADKELRAIESAARAAERKAEKIAEYDKKIVDLDNHQKVWEKAKKGKEVDKDLAAKREELRKALIKNGVKLESGSKESRAAKEKVIEAHNERVNNLKNKITDLLNDDTISDEDKKALRAVQAELNKMGVKIDAGELDDKIKKAMAATSKLHSGNITSLLTGRKAEILADLKYLSTQLKKDNNSALQDIQLAQVKSREISRKEQAERQLASGNFDDVPKLSDYKKDEELLRLTRDRKKAEHDLAYQIDKYHKENEGFWKRQLTRLQRLQRANLISGIMTNGKVLVATVVKPVSDALVRRTIGTATTPIFKALGLKGEREALNTDASIRSFQDSFKGMTQRQAAERRGTTEKALETATLNLQAANDQLKTLEGTPEHQAYKDNEYTKAVNDYQSAQYEWAASAMYDFIAPTSWKERLQILKAGVSRFEEFMGGYRGTTWADEKSKHAIGTGINRIIHTLEIFGRVHGAEKDISARQAFVEGFLKRASERIKAGEQLTPSKLEGIALQSYPDFLGGKFQNKNPVAEAIRGAEAKASEGGSLGKAFAFWLQSVTPVLKVPLNIEAEGLFKYTAGLPVAIGMTFNEIGKALKVNDMTIKDGIKDFNGTMDAIREHMQGLSPERRDQIINYANKGIFGAAMALVAGSMAAKGNLVFGGAYEKGKKKRKYLDADTGEMEELNYGEMAINGHKLGKFWSAVVMHLPPLMPAAMSATYIQKYKDERGDEKNEKGVGMAAYDGLAEVVRTAWEESALRSLGDVAQSPANIFNSFTTQMAAKNITEYFDTDEKGNLVERKADNVWEQVLLRTGGRNFVPTKEQYEDSKDEKDQEKSDKAQQYKDADPYYDKNQK